MASNKEIWYISAASAPKILKIQLSSRWFETTWCSCYVTVMGQIPVTSSCETLYSSHPFFNLNTIMPLFQHVLLNKKRICKTNIIIYYCSFIQQRCVCSYIHTCQYISFKAANDLAFSCPVLIKHVCFICGYGVYIREALQPTNMFA